ncbi:hypothetical protein GSI_06269 [Ganoderma sinense ZZ0214-1]|uniref:Uncharacterized protein n=1 Tax=Ganoderma sinense ZZ0214-1 TaxID=1077348 RepID=A0A2G8SCV2_9APHY|nr:hypothetical protein GSI_06269 [Ganoderma sinense ZZ0214-1]
MTTPPPFTSPEDFTPVKGRARQYFCQLCLPPGYKKGQAMSLTAALRHERTNTKHLDKVQERIRNDWNYDPPCDWGPIPLPAGTTAWDQSWPADRADDFILFWLENMAAEERGEKPETMDSFIDRYNKKYQDWLDSWYTGETQEIGQEEDEEEADKVGEEDGWDGVPGLWYDGGSFFPHEDGFNTVYHLPAHRTGDNCSAQFKQEQWQACAADPMSEEWVIREDPREEYLAWGFAPDELPDLHASDATPPSQPQVTLPQMKTRGQKNSNGRRGKNHGQGRDDGGRKKQGRGATDAATHARRGQRAKIY